ncbi:MAG TPA: hypothetical protein VKB65_07280 [Myxococcota bacterium]|nr:hypothetical protein [Myxococcota bacterium]
MADSPVFEWLGHALAETTSLSTLEARGTVRLALKSAGLDPARLDARQAEVVLRQVLPRELEVRGIAGAAELCEALAGQVPSQASGGAEGDSPEAVFARLGR